LEAEAKLRIQEDIRSGELGLIWSYILDYENGRNPFPDRSKHIADWRRYAVDYVGGNDFVVQLAAKMLRSGIKPIDALHVACAIHGQAEFFITTDDGLLNAGAQLDEISVTEPVGFIREVVDCLPTAKSE
jgi:hypothetical protein